MRPAEPKRVVVLYNETEELNKGEPQDLIADRGVIACAHAVAEALESKGFGVRLVTTSLDLLADLAPYPPSEYVVFNLAEGLNGRFFEEARVALTLEAMGYCFTGADGYTLATAANKARTKTLLERAGVPTPPWQLFRSADEVPLQPMYNLPFPLIVKPVSEDASLGIGPDAIVCDLESLRRRVTYINTRYRQAALAESFIDGREFNVSLWGNPVEALPLAELDFSAFPNPLERIVSFAAKWLDGSFEYEHTPVICPAKVDPRLGHTIAETARAAYEALGCKGYGRVDMRVAGGMPYVLEINPNPDISPDAGFFRAARAGGYEYAGMITRILTTALQDEPHRPAFGTIPLVSPQHHAYDHIR
ncbi:MAG: ATP-grasp domain-containing protein [Chloroflexi bacterium]|nr:ATP-grasp domain-containing protein [Chloroflexota bacterium]